MIINIIINTDLLCNAQRNEKMIIMLFIRLDINNIAVRQSFGIHANCFDSCSGDPAINSNHCYSRHTGINCHYSTQKAYTFLKICNIPVNRKAYCSTSLHCQSNGMKTYILLADPYSGCDTQRTGSYTQR